MPKDIVIIMTELALSFLLVLGFLLYNALPEQFELILAPCLWACTQHIDAHVYYSNGIKVNQKL